MPTPSSLAFGPFEFNAASFRLLRNGISVPLEPKAIDVLRLLLERAPHVVEKSEIFAVVWKDVAVTDNALTRVVAQLRKALDDDAKKPRYIETVATRGYRMVADVRPVPDAPARSALAEAGGGRHGSSEAPPLLSGSAQLSAGSRARTWSMHRTPIAAVAVVIACALALAVIFRPIWPSATAGSADAPAATTGNHLALALARPVQVTTGTGYDGMPAYSPDGSTFAFASDRSGAFEIYVQQLVPGAVPVPLTSNGRQNVQPAWSPDGKFIAFHEAARGGIWVVPSRGGSARRLVDAGSRPSWSPDGTGIAYQESDAMELTMLSPPTSPSTIHIVDPATGEARALTRSGAPAGPHTAPHWSADGRQLYFIETPAPYLSALGEAQSSIWRVEANGAGLTRLASDTLLTSEYAPARDGSGAWAVMRTASLWWQPFGGAVTAAGTPTGLTMPGMPAQLALAPNGRTLAWTARSSVTNLWAAPVPSAGALPATAARLPIGSGVRVTGAAAAPDGRLAYSGIVQGNASQIWVRDHEGGMRQVTTDEVDHFVPFWLGGFREVAYSSAHQGVVGYHAVDVTTGRERQLFRIADLPMPPTASVHPLVWLNVTPDPALGRVVATLVKNGVPNLWLFRLSSGRFEPQAVQVTFETEGGSFPHWSPDGRSLSYQCGEGRNTHTCVIGADGADRRQLTHERGQSFLGGWMEDDTILVAARRDAVWNVIGVNARTGAVTPLTAFTDARSYVRYPHWDRAGQRILFERAETTGNIWSVQLP